MPTFSKLKRYFAVQDMLAVLTWLLIFSIVLKVLPDSAEEISRKQAAIVFCFLSYLIGFFGATRDFDGVLPAWGQKTLFIVQLLSAFAIMLLIPLDFLPILTIIWSAVSLRYFNSRQAVFVTTCVVILWFGLYGLVWEQKHVVYSGLLYYSFHIFALMMGIQTNKAERASEQANALNIELMATRELLAESSKLQERTRIARELHDLLGHHLTALNINLQVAEHLATQDVHAPELPKAIQQSYFLAKLLLSDVREAVSVIRENHTLDIRSAINRIGTAFPNLSINVSMVPLECDNMALIQDLLRCVQEAVTNAVKHGGATQVDVRIETNSERLVMQIEDNGRGIDNVSYGNGLRGMQERVQAHAGTLDITSEEGSLKIHITCPLNGGEQGAGHDD